MLFRSRNNDIFNNKMQVTQIFPKENIYGTMFQVNEIVDFMELGV